MFMKSLFLPILLSLFPNYANNTINNGFGVYIAYIDNIVYDDNDMFNFSLSTSALHVGCSISLDDTIIDLQSGGNYTISDSGRGYSISLYNHDYLLDDYSRISIIGVLKTDSPYNSLGFEKYTYDISTTYRLDLFSLTSYVFVSTDYQTIPLFSGYCVNSLEDYETSGYRNLWTSIYLVPTAYDHFGDWHVNTYYIYDTLLFTNTLGDTWRFKFCNAVAENTTTIRDKTMLKYRDTYDYLQFEILEGSFDYSRLYEINNNIPQTNGAIDTIFGLITKAFEPVIMLFNIELAPNFKLGYVLLVPLLIGLILFVIKIWGSAS